MVRRYFGSVLTSFLRGSGGGRGVGGGRVELLLSAAAAAVEILYFVITYVRRISTQFPQAGRDGKGCLHIMRFVFSFMF